MAVQEKQQHQQAALEQAALEQAALDHSAPESSLRPTLHPHSREHEAFIYETPACGHASYGGHVRHEVGMEQHGTRHVGMASSSIHHVGMPSSSIHHVGMPSSSIHHVGMPPAYSSTHKSQRRPPHDLSSTRLPPPSPLPQLTPLPPPHTLHSVRPPASPPLAPAETRAIVEFARQYVSSLPTAPLQRALHPEETRAIIAFAEQYVSSVATRSEASSWAPPTPRIVARATAAHAALLREAAEPVHASVCSSSVRSSPVLGTPAHSARASTNGDNDDDETGASASRPVASRRHAGRAAEDALHVHRSAERNANRRAHDMRRLQRLRALELLDAQIEAVEGRLVGELMEPVLQHHDGPSAMRLTAHGPAWKERRDRSTSPTGHIKAQIPTRRGSALFSPAAPIAGTEPARAQKLGVRVPAAGERQLI